MVAAHDPMAEIRASFFVECDELLEKLQDALVAMDEGEHDDETINIVFRAVHSIKGGAGAFGLGALVAFAHRLETVMDAVRSGKMAVAPEAVKGFFQAADLLQDHVRAARDGGAEPAGADDVLQALETLMGRVSASDHDDEVTDFQPMGLSFSLDLPDLDAAADDAADDAACDGADPGAVATSDTPDAPWQVTFCPSPELYASGNEPYYLLRALRALGGATVRCDVSQLPGLDDLDPEAAFLTWDVRLPGDTSEAEIREVFEFVEDVCVLEVRRYPAAPDPAPAVPLDNEGSDRGQAEGAAIMPDTVQPVRSGAPSAAVAPAPATILSAPPRPAAGAPAGAPSGGAGHSEAAATVRVDLGRIDRLVNLVGELVINQAMLAQSVSDAGLPSNSAVMTGLEAFMMLTRDIQDSVMMIRAQPVKPLFQRMARIVREASGPIGKNVRLKTEGEATEVDKTVIERLADPLTHMIRNAVDHGLESSADRIAAGKPTEGVITLSAQHRSGRVIIEVKDDGAGIDRVRVRETALRRGLIPADAQLSDADTDALLFLPGFSTVSQISNLSGRGVGMDVVRSAITALGGRIAITSARGIGTTFTISLPLTLAVLDGMVVQVAGETLVVPLSSIIETAALSREDIRSLGPQGNVIHIRGGFVPLYDLGYELGFRNLKDSCAGGIVLLTTGDDGARAALIVDAIHEQRQVVIKGLQQAYGEIPGIAAATILGDGQIALIVDPPDLVRTARLRSRVPANRMPEDGLQNRRSPENGAPEPFAPRIDATDAADAAEISQPALAG